MYIRNIFTEMKNQISNIKAMTKSSYDDQMSDMRKSESEHKAIVSKSIYSMLPPDSIAKIERLGSHIGISAINMISFIDLYDFTKYMQSFK